MTREIEECLYIVTTLQLALKISGKGTREDRLRCWLFINSSYTHDVVLSFIVHFICSMFSM